MQKLSALLLVLLFVLNTQAQQNDRIINKVIKEQKVQKVEKVLSSDAMGGRGLFTPGIDKAATYIAQQFEKAGLVPLPPATGFFQEFTLIEAKQTGASGTINGHRIPEAQIIAFTANEILTINASSGYTMATMNSNDKFYNVAYGYIMSGKNYIVIVDTALRSSFSNLNRLKRPGFRLPGNVVFVLSDQSPVNFTFSIQADITEKKLRNVTGMIPGKSQSDRKDEYVVFSGHYDHLGIGKPNTAGDSVYNGANDDAAGTTAVIMLAKYFRKLNSNERSLIFSAFTAEEIGGYGSQYFSKQLDPDKVVAMFNIEMIGTDSKWGKNSAYITGYEKSDMGKIMQRNLEGTGFTFYPDPYPDQQLFYRSDNATLARLGVPAHTISTSKMDSEPYYHTVEDEIGTLDMKNMTEIIKAIALSSTSIVNGTDTPTRVEASQLR